MINESVVLSPQIRPIITHRGSFTQTSHNGRAAGRGQVEICVSCFRYLHVLARIFLSAIQMTHIGVLKSALFFSSNQVVTGAAVVLFASLEILDLFEVVQTC